MIRVSSPTQPGGAVDAPSIVAGEVDLLLVSYDEFVIEHTADISAINILSAVAGRARNIAVYLIGDGTARAVVWPWEWADEEPVLLSADGDENKFVVSTRDGVNWRAITAWQVAA